MYDWNDLKAFLAVARSGSTLGASRTLGVNQTTVARRVESLEAALCLKLVERGQSGSRLTEAGRDLVAEAEKVEAAARVFGARAQAHQRGLAGAIRVTTVEMVANMTLTPAIAEFRRQYPEVEVELIVSDDRLDIEGGEADLAIRIGALDPNSPLVARRLLDYTFRLYCSRDYAERRGVPATPAELADHDLVGGDASLNRAPALAWMFEQAGGKAAVTRSNTFNSLAHAVAAGLGVSPLPTILGDSDPNLVRCSDVIEAVTGAGWIVTRRELKDTPRMRAFIDFIVPYMREDARRREAHSRALRDGETAGAGGVP
jgi:DNA-binding transcriptional LysR family regulator